MFAVKWTKINIKGKIFQTTIFCYFKGEKLVKLKLLGKCLEHWESRRNNPKKIACVAGYNFSQPSINSATIRLRQRFALLRTIRTHTCTHNLCRLFRVFPIFKGIIIIWGFLFPCLLLPVFSVCNSEFG